MENARKIVIIGGGACGPKTAARARRLDAAAQITMIQDEGLISYAACGLPYFVAGLVKPRNALIVRDPAAFKKINNVDVVINTRVDSIDKSSKKVNVTAVSEGRSYNIDYDKLVIATGARAVVPKLPGVDLKGVHILKNVPDADEIITLIGEATTKKAVIVGAGLIGVEMAEALVARGFEVTIVEALDNVLAALLDSEISDMVAKHMKSKGVILKLGQKIMAFEGEAGKVRRAVTDKETLDAELAIVAIGVRPDSKLAKKAGIEIGPLGEIVVNDDMQTSDPDIYAGGDCVANLNIVTGKRVLSANGSIANKHGHVIAANITGHRDKFPGIVNSACVKVFDFNVGRTGITEKQAGEMGYKFVAGMLAAPDRPEYYPGNKEIVIKIVVDSNGRILGGQGVGPGDVIKRIDVLATAITMGMTVDMLANLDLCYAPPFNGALDALHHLANLVINKMAGRVESIKPAEVKEKLDQKEDFVLLDVRSHLEHDKTSLEAPQATLIPLPSLTKHIETLPKEKEIVVTCRRGGRAYQASCILKGAGFKNVKVAETGLTGWCDKVCGQPLI